jgi:hypothetical protein
MPADDHLAAEIRLLRELESKNAKAFADFYRKYSPDLLIQAYIITHDAAKARHLVDGLFEQLLIDNPFGQVQPPIHLYLFDEVGKRCKAKYPKLYAKLFPGKGQVKPGS